MLVCIFVKEYFKYVILSVLSYLMTKTNTYFLIKNLSPSTSHIKLYDCETLRLRDDWILANFFPAHLFMKL